MHRLLKTTEVRGYNSRYFGLQHYFISFYWLVLLGAISQLPSSVLFERSVHFNRNNA